MAEPPDGYTNTPDADRAKAQKFFDYGKNAADTGNYDYAITLYLQGLEVDPENTDAHQALRDISLRRKASGGKDLGFMEKMKAKGARPKDDKAAMINAEKLLAFDPGNTDNMLAIMESAHKGGYYDAVMWIGAILVQANSTSPKPDFNKYIKARDIYDALGQYKEAVDACNSAARMKPEDMDLQRELKDLGAKLTMVEGKYAGGGSFKGSIRDMAGQQKLLDKDKGIHTIDSIQRGIDEAEAELKADPNEPGKLIKFVEALRRAETPELENRAIEVLEDAFQRTAQFRWRKSAGEIKLHQLARMERTLVVTLRANPADEELKKQIAELRKTRLEEELAEYTLWVENYPTETEFKFHMANRLYQLGRFDEAIPIFQDVGNDPKYRVPARINLGCAFLGAGYVDEAVDTLRDLIGAYQLKGDPKSIEMHYFYARALEQQGDVAAALKAYSQVAQWNFNYKDVQQRIKKLRTTSGKSPGGGDPM